jgi:hypothetical protein
MQPDADGSELDGGEEVPGGFLEARGDPTEVLDPRIKSDDKPC